MPRSPILFIHGMCCTGAVWDEFTKAFAARGYDCLAPNLRHHERGADLVALGMTGIADYVDDLVALVATLPEPPVVIGHSMGGLLAQLVAARVECRAVVALSSAPPAGIWAAPFLAVTRLMPHFLHWEFWRQPMKFSFDEIRFLAFNRMPAEEQARIYAQMVPESGRAGAEIGTWWLQMPQVTRVVPDQIHCPLLFMAGGRDRLIPASTCRANAELFGNKATYREYVDHGHWLIGEPGHPSIASDILAWLDSHAAP